MRKNTTNKNTNSEKNEKGDNKIYYPEEIIKKWLASQI